MDSAFYTNLAMGTYVECVGKCNFSNIFSYDILITHIYPTLSFLLKF